jgi:hypothetical protein
MSETERSVEAIEQDQGDEPAQALTYQEQLRIAERVVAALLAGGFDCQRAEEAPVH